jgi:hypothetical protein
MIIDHNTRKHLESWLDLSLKSAITNTYSLHDLRICHSTDILDKPTVYLALHH